MSILDSSPAKGNLGLGTPRPDAPKSRVVREPVKPPWVVRLVVDLFDPLDRPISDQLRTLHATLEGYCGEKPYAFVGIATLAHWQGCGRRNMQLLLVKWEKAGLGRRVIEGRGRTCLKGFLLFKRFDPGRTVVADTPEAIAWWTAELLSDPARKANSTPLFDRAGIPGKAQSFALIPPGKAQSFAPEVRGDWKKEKHVNVGANVNVACAGGEESGAPEVDVIHQAEPTQTPPAEVETVATGDALPAAVQVPPELALAVAFVAKMLARGIGLEPGTKEDGSEGVKTIPVSGATPIRPEEIAELVALKPWVLAYLKANPGPDPSPGTGYYVPPPQPAPAVSTVEDRIRRLRFGDPEKAPGLAAELANEFAARWKDRGSVGGFRSKLVLVAKGEIPVKAALKAYQKANRCGPDANPGALWNYWLGAATEGPS